MAQRYAVENDIPFRSFPADWKRYGKRAGPIRNIEMLHESNPDLVLAFKENFDWSFTSGGTEHMVKISKAKGIAYAVYNSTK